MSVRAYRINKIEREDTPTLNCWHNGSLLDFMIDGNGWRTDSEDGIGQFEVGVDKLEEAIIALTKGEFDADYKELTMPEQEKNALIKALKRDIAWAKKHKQDYVMYDCF